MAAPRRIVLASRNRGKLAELRDLLDLGPGVEWLLVSEVAPDLRVAEDGETFEANALRKARAAAEATGLPALADDSGLLVDALGGAPGVRSARFAGEDATDERNNEELLRRLAGVPAAERTARFVCVLAFVDPGLPEAPLLASGRCEGHILEAPRGTLGFGYDPLFVPLGEERSFAQLGPEGKRRLGHRARAAEAMRCVLLDWLAGPSTSPTSPRPGRS